MAIRPGRHGAPSTRTTTVWQVALASCSASGRDPAIACASNCDTASGNSEGTTVKWIADLATAHRHDGETRRRDMRPDFGRQQDDRQGAENERDAPGADHRASATRSHASATKAGIDRDAGAVYRTRG